MKNKIAALALISCLIFGISNSPVFAEETKTMEKAMDMKKAPAKSGMSGMDPMMQMSGESIHNLINMGHKMVKDGNTAGDADKMIMGTQMLNEGMMLGHHMTMHMMMHMMDDKKMMKMHKNMSMDKMYPPEVMADIKNSMNMAAETADMMMSMGNKMVKDGNTAGDGKKMMTGGKMIHMGMMMHNMVMEGNKMMSDKNGMKKMMDEHHNMGMGMMDDDM
jgi:hypothetical protein